MAPSARFFLGESSAPCFFQVIITPPGTHHGIAVAFIPPSVSIPELFFLFPYRSVYLPRRKDSPPPLFDFPNSLAFFLSYRNFSAMFFSPFPTIIEFDLDDRDFPLPPRVFLRFIPHSRPVHFHFSSGVSGYPSAPAFLHR